VLQTERIAGLVGRERGRIFDLRGIGMMTGYAPAMCESDLCG
jgi:hypothetical protein